MGESIQFASSRDQALDQLQEFLPDSGVKYAKKRNYDFGEGHENVSRLSPCTRYRILSEKEIVAKVLEKHSYRESEKFIQEVCWRTYWKGWLEQRPELWDSFRKLCEKSELGHKTQNLYEQSLNAATGIACFDAWVSELKRTGYLHNHSRMWFASIWIHTLKLPWYLGADFFYQHLLDGDPASNTLSWRWVAGLHTKGKSYLASKSNIETYTNGRFSPDGLAENAQDISDKVSLERKALLTLDQPREQDGALVLWPDDLTADLEFSSQKRKITMIDPQWEDPEASVVKQSFRSEIIQKTQNRLEKVGHDVSVSANMREFASWTKSVDEPIVWLRPFVGYGLNLRNLIVDELPQLKIVELRRHWDEAFFPHATAGFFKLKKEIPETLKTMGLRL